MKTRDIDFKEVHLSIADFIDNESFEYLLEEFGIDRTPEKDYQLITLTVTKIVVR